MTLATMGSRTTKSKSKPHQSVKRDNLHKYIVKTLGGDRVSDAIKIPVDTNRQEWIAVNTVDFFNTISLLNSCLSDFCTIHFCPTMTASARYEYLWSEGVSKPQPCTAPEYIENVLVWVERLE
ncbi:MOB kinase activator 1B [Nowakowskiella sp. JEL0078]|nr:MOB kinase activator 1B [Nowakowskiella sp. JEL0078]